MDTETVKKTGRGFLVITAAKVWFLMTSAVIQLGLPIIFGSAEQFGVFKIVTEAIGLLNMVMIAGTLHAVSKLVSERPDQAGKIVNLAVKLQFALGVPVAALYALGSPYIAAGFNDPSLTGLLRISSMIILFYAFYAIFVGYLNGLKEFVKQASLDITFATLKMIGILGLVMLGFGVYGAVWGFVGAAGLICLFSGTWVFTLKRRRRRAAAELALEPDHEALDPPSDALKRLFGYLVLIMLYTFALNGLMRADLFILKAVAADIPAPHEHYEGVRDIFTIISNKFAGFYGAVLNIARIPYQGVIAVTFVIFPLISKSTFNDDLEQTRAYIRETLRYCLILIGGVAMLLAFNSDSIIAALYSADYQRAALALSILSVSIIFFALFYVATTMIIGSGYPLVAGIIMGVSALMSAVLNYIFVSGKHTEAMAELPWETLAAATPPAAASADLGAVEAAMATLGQATQLSQHHVEFAAPYLLQGTTYMQYSAIATTIAMLTGFVTSLCWLYFKFGATPPWATVGRLCLVALVFFGIDYAIPMSTELVAIHGKLMYLLFIVGKMFLMGLALLATLGLAREFTVTDFNRFKAVIGR